MKQFFSANPETRQLPTLALSLALGLLAAAPAAAQQVPVTPTTVYGLGYNVGTKATFILALNPANITGSGLLFQNPSGGFNAAIPVATAGVLPEGQRLVGIDARPSTGQLFALGYDYTKTTGNARLYALTLNSAGNSYTVTPVGTALLSLDLQDPSKGAFVSPPTANTLDFSTTPTPTVPQLYNVVFDFNPRADRIRVSAPRSSSGTSGITYVLNPNTGTSTAGSALTGSYTDAGGQPVPYYVGTGAYINSTFGVAGTTLYDLGINNTRGSVLTQNIATGALTEQAVLTFATQTNPSSYDPLYSPTTRIDLDFYYDRGSSSAQKNIGYVLETRRNNSNTGYTSNLYTLDFSTGNATSGRASGKNIYGASDATSGGASFIYDIAVLSSNPKVWVGLVSSAWGDANNWYPVGVPQASDDVLIAGTGTYIGFANASVANQPVVSDARVAASITLTNGALLTTADGATLTISGDFVNTDSQVAGSGTGTLALNGPASQDIGGNTATTFQNLSVGAAGATTSAGVAITRSVTAGGTLAIGAGQAFTLLSSANGTAYVVNTGSGTVTGTATVQRYITPTNAGLGYRHYSSPVTRNAAVATSNQVSDLATPGFSPVVNPAYNSAANPRQVRPYPTVFYYDQARLASSNASYAVGDFDNGFLSPGDVTDVLETGRGYTVNIGSSALVDFQGTLNQASSYPRPGLGRGAQASAGYHLLGNPYPGALNYDVVIANSAGMESALYVYKSTGQYAGTYTTYVPGSAPANGGPVATNGGTSNIPVAQGFFMRTAAGQTGSVTISASARTNAPETALFQRTAADPRPMLALTLRNASLANQMRVYFDQEATPAFDAKYDAHYLPATHGLDLASDLSTEALAINALPELKATTTVPLHVHALTAGTYTLAVDELTNLPAGYRAYLRDASTGTYTDLTTTPSVSLTLAPGEAPTGRFALLFTAASPLATAPAALAALAAVYPSPAHGAATLVLPQALRGNSASTVQLLNALGQVVLTKTVAAGSGTTVALPLTGIAAGIYTVRATTEAGLVAKRLVVQ